MFNFILTEFNLISNLIADFLLNSSNFLNFVPIWLMIGLNFVGVFAIIIVGPIPFLMSLYNPDLKSKFFNLGK